MRDSNPRHPRCKGGDGSLEGDTGQQLTTPPIPVCTSVCTSDAENANGPPAVAPIDPALATLAAALLNLDPAARAALAAMLLKTDR